jgi:threonine/homoserine/homoserine lactone efflux protein
MIPPDTLAAFFVASVALGIAPGPDNLFVLAQSTLHGARAGMMVVLGLCSGLLVHTAAVAAGLAALLQASAIAFTVLKMLGAAYLLWLAWQAWRAAGASLAGTAPASAALSARQYYLRGIAMNLSNPKVSLFFLAFLPQFVDPARAAPAPQFLLLGGVFIVATLLVFGAIALAAARIGNWLGSAPCAHAWLNRVAALIFVALAARLALSEH